jgi:hypothetical protein
MTSNDRDSSSDAPKAKKPYTAPELSRWGSMRDITMAVGVSGSTDGGKSKSANRTH